MIPEAVDSLLWYAIRRNDARVDRQKRIRNWESLAKIWGGKSQPPVSGCCCSQATKATKPAQ